MPDHLEIPYVKQDADEYLFFFSVDKSKGVIIKQNRDPKVVLDKQLLGSERKRGGGGHREYHRIFGYFFDKVEEIEPYLDAFGAIY